MKRYVVAAFYAVWLVAVEFIFYWVRGHDPSSLQHVVMLGVIPPAVQFALLGLNPYGLVAPARLFIVFLLIVLFSYLSNGSGGEAFDYVMELMFIFGVAMVIAGSPDPQLIRAIAVIAGVLNAVFLLYIDFFGEYVWGRLYAAGIDPNWWGLMAGWGAAGAFAYRSWLAGGFCFGVGLLTMYESQSRGTMVAILAALAVLGFLYVKQLRGSRLMVATAIVAGCLGTLVIMSSVIQSEVVNAVLNDVFKVDDPQRGAGQGLTGRTDFWGEALDLWQRSPLFGIGFRQHENYLSGASNAHNAYLAMMADTGTAGLVWYVAFVFLSLAAAFRIPDRGTRNLVIATIVTYMMIGMFERRAINGGNPFSVYYLVCCCYALAQKQWLGAIAGTALAPIAAQGAFTDHRLRALSSARSSLFAADGTVEK